MSMAIVAILVEGELDHIFYEHYIRRVMGGQRVGHEVLPEPIRELLEEARRVRFDVLKLEDRLLVLVRCGGFEAMRALLGLLLRHRDELVREGLCDVILVSDADKNVRATIEGKVGSILGSCGWQWQDEHAILVEVSGRKLRISGITHGLSGKGRTGQLEDLVELLATKLYPREEHAIRMLEAELGRELNSKQKASIFAALLSKHQSKEELVAGLLRSAKNHHLEQLRDLLRELEEALRP